MQKNKLNLLICGIHLLNPYKTVVSHLNSIDKRNDFTESEGVKYRTFNDQLKNKCNSADDWAKLKVKTVLNQLASFY